MVTLASYDFEEAVEWGGFIGGHAAFVTVDGVLHRPVVSDVPIDIAEGALAVADRSPGGGLVLADETGRIIAVDNTADVQILHHQKDQWIDRLAIGPQGTIAFSAGRQLWLRAADGSVKDFALDHAVEGIAFAPKGLRMAVARYNGVSLIWGAGSADPGALEWDGPHTGVTFSPDGKYVVTTMAENALHGWRLDVKKGQNAHMRMSGYPAKPKAMSWSARGKWLATSGAQSAICWPFSGKDGPMGKAPAELGFRQDTMVVDVACHPVEQVVAVGYADGMIMLLRIDDAAETLLRRPGQGKLSSLAWDQVGDRLVFGTDAG